MNKTLWQIRDSIMEAIHSYEITDDRQIEDEMVEDKIVDLRSSIILAEALAGPLDPGYYQQMENLEVIYGDHTLEISSGVFAMKTRNMGYVMVPGLNTRIGRAAVSYFGLPDYSYNFDHRNMQGLLTNRSAMYTSSRFVYAMSGDKVFVKNYGHEGKKYVSVLAVLEDPRKIKGYDYKTSWFPISDPQKLELLVIKHFLTTMGFAPDKMNDANVNLQQPQQQQQSQQQQQ